MEAQRGGHATRGAAGATSAPHQMDVVPTGFPDPLDSVVKYSLAPGPTLARPLRLANPLASALQEAIIEGRPTNIRFGESLTCLPHSSDGIMVLQEQPNVGVHSAAFALGSSSLADRHTLARAPTTDSTLVLPTATGPIADRIGTHVPKMKVLGHIRHICSVSPYMRQ